MAETYSGENNGATVASPANKQPSGSKPGPKPAHSHAPYGMGSAPSGGKGGEQKKASTPGKTGANKNYLR